MTNNKSKHSENKYTEWPQKPRAQKQRAITANKNLVLMTTFLSSSALKGYITASYHAISHVQLTCVQVRLNGTERQTEREPSLASQSPPSSGRESKEGKGRRETFTSLPSIKGSGMILIPRVVRSNPIPTLLCMQFAHSHRPKAWSQANKWRYIAHSVQLYVYTCFILL